MGKYRSAAFKGSLDKEVAQEIADFIGAVTEQEAIVIVSCVTADSEAAMIIDVIKQCM